jgi:hypothetical protein
VIDPRRRELKRSVPQVHVEATQDPPPGVLRRRLVVADPGDAQQRPAGPEVMPVEERVASVAVLVNVVLDLRLLERGAERRGRPRSVLSFAP